MRKFFTSWKVWMIWWPEWCSSHFCQFKGKATLEKDCEDPPNSISPLEFDCYPKIMRSILLEISRLLCFDVLNANDERIGGMMYWQFHVSVIILHQIAFLTYSVTFFFIQFLSFFIVTDTWLYGSIKGWSVGRSLSRFFLGFLSLPSYLQLSGWS